MTSEGKYQPARFSTAPLVELEPPLVRTSAGRGHANHVDGGELSFALRLGIDRAFWHRIKQRGWVSMVQADRAACALGYHPCELWPDWWESQGWREST